MNFGALFKVKLWLNFFVLFLKLQNSIFFLFLQKSQHVLEHFLKSDIPCVASRMSRFCINLEGITKSESGSVLSKATKVSGSD